MITTQLNITEQLTTIYFTQEWWHHNKLPREEAMKYHSKLYNDGNITVYLKDEEVLGYLEVWRINFEQFGKLICHAPFSAYLQDIKSGNIAYVANTWIAPEHRGGVVYKYLRNSFFINNHSCDYFVGQAMRKRTQPIKVFKKSNLSSKLFNKGVM